MKVMGLDSAMRATGYIVMEVDPQAIVTLQSPQPTHPIMNFVHGGTLNYADTTETRLDRMVQNANAVHKLFAEYRPEVVVIEGALDKGLNRSSTGTALYALITAPWHPSRGEYLGLVDGSYPVPKVVITLSPERHMAMAHQKRLLTGTEKVKRYREVSSYNYKGRVSEHLADSYFLAYHGLRFWLTHQKIWPVSILTPSEYAIFHDCTQRHPATNRRLASKSMANEEGISWWTNVQPAVHQPAVESTECSVSHDNHNITG